MMYVKPVDAESPPVELVKEREDGGRVRIECIFRKNASKAFFPTENFWRYPLPTSLLFYTPEHFRADEEVMVNDADRCAVEPRSSRKSSRVVGGSGREVGGPSKLGWNRAKSFCHLFASNVAPGHQRSLVYAVAFPSYPRYDGKATARLMGRRLPDMLDWGEIRRSGWPRNCLTSCKTVHSNTCRMWSGIILLKNKSRVLQKELVARQFSECRRRTTLL
ncbi:hypothetical protein TNCV_1542681 [Trichonephila clavipes]|nr:hypothetical protein TNCV_1542681 [Trichonephila clavipes]